MELEQISKLMQPYLSRNLPPDQVAQVAEYLQLLQRWNERTNLTGLRSPEDMVRRHFGESFAVAEWLLAEYDLRGKVLFDLGSGAGFPGGPIAIARPELRVILIESQGKKATFLREVVRALALKNCSVHTGRAESLHSYADFVTMRAVDRSSVMESVALRLLVPRGTLVQVIGARQEKEAPVRTLANGVRIVAVMK
ncbi:MAG: hypothetical protein NVS9B15_21410 [Acidobacteriaceae bacterium]